MANDDPIRASLKERAMDGSLVNVVKKDQDSECVFELRLKGSIPDGGKKDRKKKKGKK